MIPELIGGRSVIHIGAHVDEGLFQRFQSETVMFDVKVKVILLTARTGLEHFLKLDKYPIHQLPLLYHVYMN